MSSRLWKDPDEKKKHDGATTRNVVNIEPEEWEGSESEEYQEKETSTFI